MPADCTGTVVETRAPEVLEEPAGWPAAVATSAAQEDAQEIAKLCRRAPFPKTENPALRAAIEAARAARRERLTASTAGARLRKAFFSRRDSEELKTLRLAAKAAVPFPKELMVPRAPGERFLTAVVEVFSDGTQRESRAAARDTDPQVRHLEYAWEISKHFAGDDAAHLQAIRAWGDWEKAKEKAAEGVADLPALEQAYRQNIPAEQASYESRDGAEASLKGAVVTTLADAVAKAKAIAALECATITAEGEVKGSRETGLGGQVTERVLEMLWPDLLTLIAPEPSRAEGPAASWTKAVAMEAECGTCEAEVPAPLLDALWAEEEACLKGEISTRADALAKLQAVRKGLERGHREDGLDEDALADAIRWLEAH